jgi:hypothetical protein
MRTLLLVILYVPFLSIVNAQSREDIRESFDEGEYFFVRGEFSEAAYYFRKVVDSFPNNSHYNFKLGECYMNIPGSEALAIPCFEKATANAVTKKKYRSKDIAENNAPLHAWFYLGNVYRINGRLEDALNAYVTFINSPFYYGNYNVNVVENEIKSCERAKILMDNPVDLIIEAMDTIINTSASELYPVVTANEQTMVFIRKLKFYDAIFYTTKQGDSWSQPVNLNPLVGSDGDFYPVSLSPDGNELYMVKTSLENKDLYVSYRRNSIWTKAEPLNKNINTRADETWACISSDGQTLWFTSSRKGGLGGLDLYYSRRDKNLQWGKAKNAGKIINTPFDEESPCLNYNDQILFFSSKGHYSMGGFDIFYTSKNGKDWKEPVNIGFPINNTTDNLGFITAGNGKTGYYSRINVSGEASAEDIFRVIFKSNYPLP